MNSKLTNQTLNVCHVNGASERPLLRNQNHIPDDDVAYETLFNQEINLERVYSLIYIVIKIIK